jgi:hypothetical protein
MRQPLVIYPAQVYNFREERSRNRFSLLVVNRAVGPNYPNWEAAMGDYPVELGERELEKIGKYVKAHLPEWMGEVRRDWELDMTERIVRVEEEVKNLREVMNARFESVDTRFDSMNKRFTSLQWTMGLGFTVLAGLMGIFNFT